MVLTQPTIKAKWLENVKLFPYHYGSHATQISSLSRSASRVSIPLWFSRNSMRSDRKYKGNNVSIPLWFSRNRTKPCTGERRWSFHTTMVLTQPYQHDTCYCYVLPVSIPLWFSRNPNHPGAYGKISSFHTTMVLTQPVLRGAALTNMRFHTTMVLTQPRKFNIKEVEARFPYHYGSHATRKCKTIHL